MLGDNTGGRTFMLRPIRFQCVGVWISNGLPCIYMYLTLCILSSDLRKIRLALDLTQRNSYISRGMSVTFLLRLDVPAVSCPMPITLIGAIVPPASFV